MHAQNKQSATKTVCCCIVCHCIQNLADVVACNRNPSTGMVEALDAWNVQSYGNDIDSIQDVELRTGSYLGGRISCR